MGRKQYKIYLFQMILLCCKEMNTKKEKNKNKQSTDRRGRTKLQLKGRIFMQNVTDTVCQSKPGMRSLSHPINISLTI